MDGPTYEHDVLPVSAARSGPLTLILKAADVVPECITAGTGFVGVRCPAHPVTRQLLSLAGVPVAAPSANRFGHVRYGLLTCVLSFGDTRRSGAYGWYGNALSSGMPRESSW